MTISQLVAETGVQMRVFDMGRKIHKIGRSDFEAFENLAKAYPTPYLRHAWLGILTWRPDEPGQHNIWFLKLPLDEQNILQPGPRDAFLQHWLKVVQYPDKELGEAPCHYKPDGNRMAYFHALSLSVLKQSPTQYYATARAYLSGDTGWDQWQHLGIQGIAEVVARIEEDHNRDLLIAALPQMPSVPRNIFLGFLENIEVDHTVSLALSDLFTQLTAGEPEGADLAAICRAVSSCVSESTRQALLTQVLAQPKATELEVLSAVGSRCWQDLKGELMLTYLELLAARGQDVFVALVADLMTLPGQRARVMEAFRHPTRTDELTNAIGSFMAMARGHTQ